MAGFEKACLPSSYRTGVNGFRGVGGGGEGQLDTHFIPPDNSQHSKVMQCVVDSLSALRKSEKAQWTGENILLIPTPHIYPTRETRMSKSLLHPVGNAQPCFPHPREAWTSWMKWQRWLLPQSMMWTTQEEPTLSSATQAVNWQCSTMTQPSWRVTTRPWPSSWQSRTANATFSRTLTGRLYLGSCAQVCEVKGGYSVFPNFSKYLASS